MNFSVIIPHKNTPELLCRCFDSIPERDDLEIIIVDDDSSINVKEKLKTLPFVDCIYFLENSKGAGHARNYGLLKSKGKWLIFADSDDFFSENFNSLLERKLNSDNDIIYFSNKSVDSENIMLQTDRGITRFQKYYNIYNSNKEFGEELFRFNITEPWGKFFRKELIKVNQIYFDETPVSNDYSFSVKSGYFAKKIEIDTTPMYTVTTRSDSLSYNFADKFSILYTRIQVACNVILFFESKNVNYTINPLRNLLLILIRKYPHKIIVVLRLLIKNKVRVFNHFKSIFIYTKI